MHARHEQSHIPLYSFHLHGLALDPFVIHGTENYKGKGFVVPNYCIQLTDTLANNYKLMCLSIEYRHIS